MNGLLLVGGASSRMGSDKALLSYNGNQSQLQKSCLLLQQVCDKVFVSQRKEQAFKVPENTESIFDAAIEAKGPLRGILSALHHSKDVDWLILACDLPNLQVEDLNHLISSFHALDTPNFTAFQSHYDGLPEPLCAIYPKKSHIQLEKLAIELGKYCPRKLLINSNTILVEQRNPHSMDNINTAEEFKSYQSAHNN